MLYFSPGSHAQTLFALLAVAGEFPVSSLHLLGNVRVYKALICKMCRKQIVRHTGTGETVETRLLSVSGKGADATIRLYKGALPILKWLGADAYYHDAFPGHKFRGDRAHRERNHRVAEAAAMSMRAGFAFEPYRLPALQNQAIRNIVPVEPVFYTAKQLKTIGDGEAGKTIFTRTVGALFSHGVCYSVYNTRDAVMKWNGMAEFKALYALTEAARLNAGIREVDSAILFGASEQTALRTLLARYHRPGFRFDSIYHHIHFFPMSPDGIRRLRWVGIPDWKETLSAMLFCREERSFGRGQFDYDAFLQGKYIFSHLDGDLARLNRLRDALEPGLAQQLEILCFPDQLGLIQGYMGDRVGVRIIGVDAVEKAWQTENLYF